MQKKISKIYENISQKIKMHEKETRGKYEKLKRLFSLITDIS